MSNLLDKASVILTPTAYNNGEALCVKPSDGSGDFDFSRNSAATRVNAQGLVENVQSLGSELVTNGDFDTDSDWSKGTGWSISGGSANCDGTQTSQTNLLQNGLALGTGKILKITFQLKDYQAGKLIYVNLTGTGVLEFENINANGTYVAYSGLSTGDNFITFRADADFIGSIDNVSVKEVIDNTNLPRISYENFSYDGSGNIIPNSGCGSWLFESQSTNVVPYSSDFSQWTGIINLSIGLNEGVSPSGEVNANLLSLGVDVSATRHRLYLLYNFVLGNEYTFSVFAKKDEQDWFQLMYGAAFDAQSYANFDLANGVVGNVGTSTDANIVDYGNGWYRCSITCTATATISSTYEILTTNNTNSGRYPSYQSTTNTNVCFLWGAQVEQQPYATSYIPTSGSTVTRNQDVCTNGGSLATINSTEGVLYAEIAALADDGTSRRITLLESLNNKVSVILSPTSNSIQGLVLSGGRVQFNQTFATSNTLDFNKIAVSYAENNFALWVNGVKVRTDTSGVTFSENTLTNISFADGNNTSNKFFGKTKCLAVFPYLTDAELTELTTI